ncbi:fatty acid desaturase [Paraburkholderia sp. BL9I2N2]|uniref:fatty acid desaturase n=1 Tax=Paraburkholderia sp. BL9I2N2 TaxID=1938809 RepID=UPI0010534BC2|nr:fatty acid desaturase [Paraburkholderia sp. BL9I2N2]
MRKKMTSLRNRKGGFWLSTLLPAAAAALFFFGYPWLFLLLLVAVVPAADALIGQDVEVTNRRASHAPGGPAIPVTYICVWGIAVLVALDRAVTARPLEFAGLVIASGVVSAFAMAHIHEVMHRGGRRSRLISDVALAVAGYPHYRVVHQLHHEHVGDPRFGSTAHVGLSVWCHVGRSFFAALRSAIAYERGQIRHWRENRLLPIVLVSVAVVALFAWFGGWRGAVFYLGQGILAVFIVETVGYLQHYGLCGTPDELGNQVAWDVNFWLSNRLLVNNGLHTRHHLEQTHTYDRLVQTGRALPGGYLHMFGLALIPPLWFSVMNHRLPRASD